MDECDDDTCEYAIEVSVVPKIESTELLRRAQSGGMSSADIEALLGLDELLEFGYRERLLGSNANAFRALREDPNYRSMLRKLAEALIGTFALIMISDAVPVR